MHLTKGFQHLFKGALLLSYNATDSRLFLRFFLSPLLIPSWQPSRPYHDMSSQLCTSQFRIYSSYITDWSGTLFKKFVLATSRRSKQLTLLLALLLTSIRQALLTSHASLPGPLYENSHPENSEYFYCGKRLLGTITISST